MKSNLDKPPRRMRVVFVVLAALAVVAASVVTYHRSISEHRPDASAVTPSAVALQKETYQKVGATAVVEPAPSVPERAPGESRTAMIDRLIASGKPADAQAAFRFIEDCVTARRMEPYVAAASEEIVKAAFKRNFSAPAQACDGVAAGHVTQRLPLALKAAEAGLPRSYLDLWALGAQDPFVQHDAAYVLAFPAIRDAAIQRADKDALMSRYQYLSNCNDPPKCSNVDLAESLKLWTAYVEVGGLRQNPDTVTPQLSKALGAEQAEIAIRKGYALVAAARGTK